MSKTNTEIFLSFRQRLIKAILANPDYQKAKASGNFESFIQNPSSFLVTELSFLQKGTEYTKEIDKGRPPILKDLSKLMQSMYEWLIYKKYGLNWNTESERKTLAFLLAKKNVQKGSFKYRNPSQRTNSIQDSVNKELPRLLEDLAKNQADKLGVEIKKIHGNFN